MVVTTPVQNEMEDHARILVDESSNYNIVLGYNWVLPCLTTKFKPNCEN
jgi:hypothetical protein